jgi:hypothetical protein
MHPTRFLLPLLLLTTARAAEPPPYVPAKAYYILPETTSEESGYFSLSESLDGRIHVGSAKYGHNSYLVEFDPVTEKQRIVLDVHKTCGLTATGYAAQAKLHTRNFVGPSGKIYVGSKQGYPIEGDKQEYPGGYVMTYDPRMGRTENLGMPFPKQGVIDVTADEARGKLYVVTCEDQHWMTGPLAGGTWKELGPLLTPYAMTLVDGRGVASAITKDFALAQYDPAADKVSTRAIMVDGQAWSRKDANSIPTWQLDPDGRHAWLILMNDPTLLRIDLHSGAAENRGKMIEGKNPDSRCALTLHPDGKIYALVKTDNETGFGTGYLHHLCRYDPAAKKHEDLGVLKITNPDFFNFGPDKDGKTPHHSHGFHKLADGTLTPLHVHMALIATRDGTLYGTTIYPFTLMRMDGYKLPSPAPSAASQYLDALKVKLDETAARLPEITKIAETIAARHERGGLIGFPWLGTTLEQELFGRAGGLMHIGFDRAWKPERSTEEKANDVVIYAWDDAPTPNDLKRVQDDKAKGLFVLGFGAKKSAALAPHVAACDAWIDTGAGDDDRVVPLPSGRRAGKTNHFVNAMNGWCFIAEFVSALTRRGKMPAMWKAWITEDGKAWSEKYFQKVQFHDEFKVPPVPAGELATRYLERIRYLMERLQRTELPDIRSFAADIAVELRAGKKTTVASSGHMAMSWIARWDDAAWGLNHEVHDNVPSQMESFAKDTPDGGLVLRLDAYGLHRSVGELFQKKQQRVLLITSENPRPEFAVPANYTRKIDMGYAHGDACVWLEGYPIPILPPSGVIMVAAYEALNAEVTAAGP